MANIAPRTGIEPTLLGFWFSALTITPFRAPWCHHPARDYLFMQLLAWEVYYARCPGIVSLLTLTITYTQVVASIYVYIHRVGSTATQLVQDPGHDIGVIGVMLWLYPRICLCHCLSERSVQTTTVSLKKIKNFNKYCRVKQNNQRTRWE